MNLYSLQLNYFHAPKDAAFSGGSLITETKQVGSPKSTPPSKLDICFWSDRAISASRQNRLQAVSILKINILGWTIENQGNAQIHEFGGSAAWGYNR